MLPEPNLVPAFVEFSVEYGALLRRVEAAATGDGIGAAESRILRLLLEREASPPEIRRRLQMDRGHMSRLLGSLRTKGLIAPSKSAPKDLVLTVDGRARAMALTNRLSASAQTVWNGLDDASRERFLATVSQLGDQVFHLKDVGPQIRDAEAGEAGILVRGAVRTLTQSYYGYDQTLEPTLLGIFARLLTGKNIILVVERHRALVGGIAVAIDQPKFTGTIEYFAIFECEQGRGWGTQLLESATSRAKSVGLKRLVIEMPVSRDGDSYFAARGKDWKRAGVKKQVWCGCLREWETWTRSL